MKFTLWKIIKYFHLNGDWKPLHDLLKTCCRPSDWKPANQEANRILFADDADMSDNFDVYVTEELHSQRSDKRILVALSTHVRSSVKYGNRILILTGQHCLEVKWTIRLSTQMSCQKGKVVWQLWLWLLWVSVYISNSSGRSNSNDSKKPSSCYYILSSPHPFKNMLLAIFPVKAFKTTDALPTVKFG